MQITYGKPTSKGVTQLMYVGDDASTALATPGYRWWLVAAGIFVMGWWFGKRT